MKFDLMLTGVGGEGVLTAGVILARAAGIEGYYVRGVQLHGLAQRGGTIPTFVRFGSEEKIYSPGIMEGNSDLILGFEPLEAVRAVYYARKEKTRFVINDFPYMPVYANLLNVPYPKMSEIVKRIRPFAKEIHVFKARQVANEKFGEVIFGDIILIGSAMGMGLIPLKKKSLEESIKITAPRDVETNLKAFKLGLEYGKDKEKIEETVE